MNSATVRECAGHDTHVDMTVRMRPEAAPILSTMLEMFDLADAFCRGERLLSRPVKRIPMLGREPPPTGLRTEFPDVATLAGYSVDGFDVGAGAAERYPAWTGPRSACRSTLICALERLRARG